MNKVVTKGPSEGKEYSFLHQVFRIGILLKGLFALSELVGGIVLLCVDSVSIQNWIRNIFSNIILEHPDSLVAKLEKILTGTITPEGQLFAGWYLISHGIIKLLVVFCLLRAWLWAYPVAIFVFIGFMVFQTFEYFMGSHSWTYIALDVFDGFIIWLTVNEWRHAQNHKRSV